MTSSKRCRPRLSSLSSPETFNPCRFSRRFCLFRLRLSRFRIREMLYYKIASLALRTTHTLPGARIDEMPLNQTAKGMARLATTATAAADFVQSVGPARRRCERIRFADCDWSCTIHRTRTVSTDRHEALSHFTNSTLNSPSLDAQGRLEIRLFRRAASDRGARVGRRRLAAGHLQ